MRYLVTVDVGFRGKGPTEQIEVEADDAEVTKALADGFITPVPPPAASQPDEKIAAAEPSTQRKQKNAL